MVRSDQLIQFRNRVSLLLASINCNWAIDIDVYPKISDRKYGFVVLDAMFPKELFGALQSVNQRQYHHYFTTFRPNALNCLQSGLSPCDNVVENYDTIARFEVSFNEFLGSVIFHVVPHPEPFHRPMP